MSMRESPTKTAIGTINFGPLTRLKHKQRKHILKRKPLKTAFSVGTFMGSRLFEENEELSVAGKPFKTNKKAGTTYQHVFAAGKTLSVIKLGGYVSSRKHEKAQLKSYCRGGFS